MSDKVLIYSRFPKALMQRIGERFELFDAAGKPPNEVFPADQLAGIRAMITAGGTPLGGDVMGLMPNLGAIKKKKKNMPEKVLIYSRFPKAQMERFGERFELLNTAGKPPNEVFPAEQLADIRAMITAGGTPLGGERWT